MCATILNGLACGNRGLQNTDPNESILVAAGGGYSGVYSGYRLWRDGRVEFWKQQAGRSDSVASRQSIGTDTVEYFFARLRFIAFRRLTVNTPGNLTKIIRYAATDVLHEVKWGDVTSLPPQTLELFYQDFMSLMRSRAGNDE